MTNITEIAKKLSERITNPETLKRSRTAEEYQRFLYAIEYILTDNGKHLTYILKLNAPFTSTITTTQVILDTVTQTLLTE